MATFHWENHLQSREICSLPCQITAWQKKKKQVVDLFPHFVRLCSTRFSINQHMQVSHAHIQRYAMTDYKWICPFCMYGKTIVDIFTASPVDQWTTLQTSGRLVTCGYMQFDLISISISIYLSIYLYIYIYMYLCTYTHTYIFIYI